MTNRIRVSFYRNGNARCINASREGITLHFPGSELPLHVPAYSRFEGNRQKHDMEKLPAAKAPDIDVGAAQYPAPVRRASENDISALMEFVPRIVAENSLLPVSEIKIERLIERCVMRESGAIVGVIDGDDGIDASVGWMFSESDISDIRYVRTVWLGLNPNARRMTAKQNDPRSHYAKSLFDFAKWCQAGLERVGGEPVLLQLDVATKATLGAKVGLYQRNALQVGATFAFGAVDEFLIQEPGEAA